MAETETLTISLETRRWYETENTTLAVGYRDEFDRFKRSRSQQDHKWSNKNFWRHFITCLQNAWTYFNET